MNHQELEAEVVRTLHSMVGKPEPLSPEELAAVPTLGIYHCAIVVIGSCNAGLNGVQAVHNYDTRRAYNVTVRVIWSSGVNSGTRFDTHYVPAGSRVTLGCTTTGGVPSTGYTRSITGESPA